MKRKLLLAMLCIAGSLSIHAQKDVTSQYITNAKLSDGTNGWTKTFTKNQQTNDPADAFSNSVRGNNTAGYASEAYAGWGSLIQTAYSMKQTITLPKGNYTLVSYSFFRQGDANDADHNNVSKAYLKAGSQSVLLKSLRSIAATGYANSQAEGANAFDSKMYRNTLDFTIDADNTAIEIGIEGTFDEARSWCIVGQFELIDNGQAATMDAPFDVTGYITNPGFEYRDMTGWTLSGENAIKAHDGNQSFKVGGWFAEQWQSSELGDLSARSMSQTLTEKPAGLYRLTANLGGDGTYLELNGKTANWTEDKDYTVSYVLAANENLTITAGKTTTQSNTNWIHFDNFKLLYCGDVQAALTTSLDKKTSYNGLIPTAAYNKLLTDVEQYDQQYTDVDALIAAIDAVEALYTEADKLKAPYAAWKALKDQADVLVAVSNNNTTANGTLTGAISNQNTAAEASNTVDALTTATNTLKTAMVTYVKAAEPTNDECFDLTFMIVNSHFKEGTAANPTGWTATWPDNPTGGWGGANELRIATHNFEAYHKAFELSQTIEDLPKGTYKVTLQGFARHDGADTDKTNLFCGMMNQPFMNITDEYSTTKLTEGKPALGDNNGESSRKIGDQTVYQPNGMSGSYYYFQETNPATHQPFYTNEVETLITEAGDLTIGFKCETWSDWVIWDNFHLYYYGSAIAVTIDEDVSKTFSSDVENANVTLNRTIKEGLNTLVLPFSMTQDEVVDNFGAGSKVYVVDSYTAATSTVTFKEQTTGITANEPCILQATEGGESYVLDNRTIVAEEPTVTKGNLQFIGSYAASTTIASGEGNFILYGGELLAVDSEEEGDVVTLKGTRAYFKVTDEAPGAGSRVLSVTFEGGEATGIAEIEDVEIADGLIYNLAGQVVGPDYKGIAIINGKKVLMK